MMGGIRARILFAVLAPLLIVIVLLCIQFVSVRIEDARGGLIEQGLQLSRYIASASEFNILVGDLEALQEFANAQIKNTPHLKALAFVDDRGAIIVKAGEQEELEYILDCFYTISGCAQNSGRLFFNELFDRSELAVETNPELMPEGGQDQTVTTPLGRIVFSLDTEPLTNLQVQLIRDGIYIALVALLLSGLLAYIFSKTISNPIINLSNVVRTIRQGDLSARVELIGTGELLELEKGVNQMAKQVEDSAQQLQQKVEKATEDLLLTLAQLQVKNQDLEDANKQVQEASRAKDLFLAKMSHELRTPLSSVIGYAKLVQTANTDEEREEYVKIVEHASGILLATIDDILDYTRLEGGNVKLETVDFDLREFLTSVVAMQAQEALKKGLFLDCDIAADVPNRACGDPFRLAQIIGNLLSNAIKFTAEGFVRLVASVEQKDIGLALKLQIIDSGIGIPEEKQAQLFKPFIQADDSISRRYGGSGLGLSIVKRLVEAMDGTISLSSGEAGRGLVVSLIVYLREQSEVSQAVETSDIPSAPTTVLLVEDSDLNRRLMKIQLTDLGVEVIEAEDGKKALEFACEAKGYDFVLMDVHMPGLDGVELAAELLRLRPGAPVYAFTANVTGSEEEQLIEAGVGKVFYKPVSSETLKNLLRYERSSVASNIELQDLEIEPDIGAKDASQSQLVIPNGIQKQDVIDDLMSLWNETQLAFKCGDWPSVFDFSHKMLGSARMYTRGHIADLVYDLEVIAREQSAESFQQCLERVQREIENIQCQLRANE